MVGKENDFNRLGRIVQIYVSVRVWVLVTSDGADEKVHPTSLSPPSALMSVMEALEHVDLQERARRCPRGFAEPLLLAPLPLYALRIRAPYSRSRQTVIVAAMSSLVSPAPSAFTLRRRSVRIRCTRFPRSARGMPRRRAISA